MLASCEWGTGLNGRTVFRRFIASGPDWSETAMADDLDKPLLGESVELSDEDYRYGVGPIVAIIVETIERIEYNNEPWWFVDAQVAQGTYQTIRHFSGNRFTSAILPTNTRCSRRSRQVLPNRRLPEAMKRDDLIDALKELPDNTEIEFRLGGWYFDIVSVGYDEQRKTSVLEVFQVGEDPAATHESRWKVVPKEWGLGNTT
jgi:hypothetical protein